METTLLSLVLRTLLAVLLAAGASPSYSQAPAPFDSVRPEPGPGGAKSKEAQDRLRPGAGPAPNGNGPEVVPIETRAWAHEGFGRLVFDWPWAVAYGAQREGTTLTVMFDRRLYTTFRQVPRYLGAYITAIDLGPDRQSVVATLTDEYRLRTFLLSGEDGGVKVVVDLLADGAAGPSVGLGTGPILAQAPALPSPEPSPEAVPGDEASPIISGDSPLPSAEARPETSPAELPPSLPFAVEVDASPETASESSPPERGENPPRPSATPPKRGEEEPVKADTDAPPAESDSAPESVQTAEAMPPTEETAASEPVTEPAPEVVPPAETAAAPEITPPAESTPETVSAETPPVETAISPHSGPLRPGSGQALPAREGAEDSPTTEVVAPSTEDMPSPPGRGAAQRRDGSTDALPSPLDPTGEQVAEQSADQTAVPPVGAATEPPEGNPPRPSATPPERGAEEATPPAEPTPETVSAETPQTETAISPHPDPLPEGEGEGVASTPDASSEETAAATEDTSSTETAKPAAKEKPSVTTDPTPESLTPNPQFPTLSASVQIPVSQSRLFRLDTPVASVFVANPDIADVQLVSSGVLFVVAKAVGRTSVAALDAGSELVGEWTIATVLDIQPARAAIEGVAALKSVVVRQLNRGVELSGTVASIAAADLALRLTTTALPEETPVENRISVTGKQQVNLEVQIAEVQRSVSETLGFNWEVLPDIGAGRDLGMRVGRFFFSEATGFVSQSLPGGQAAALFGSTGTSPGRTTVRGLIDALATAGLATVLARPNVTAVSGETASFFSGGEYPLPAGFEDGAIIFEYKKYGVLLDFVPTIIDSGRIMLTVRPEVSQRSDTDSLTVTGLDIPVINVRRAETTVEVGDGESIVIAGLYRDQSEAVEAGLPVVKDIPLLGMLFGSQSVRSNATELIVVVTARLTTATTMPRTTDRDRQLPGRRVRGYHY